MDRVTVITAELAWRMREQRGLALPTDRQYATGRLGEIAVRQVELLEELHQLDRELKRLADEEVQGRNLESDT